MGAALTRAIPKDWGCSEFRSASRGWEERARFSPSRAAASPCRWNCRSTLRIPARTETRACVKPIRILLADDHTVMRRGLRLLLESRPEFSVVAEASDGREAVEQAETLRPDVAVMDIGMPHLNGIEAAQRINNA